LTSNDDLALERIKKKYLNKNSPEQKKDEALRKSSEQIMEETKQYTDQMRRS
jgi:hypothetical protein